MSFAATLAAELCRAGNSDVFLVAADPVPRVSGGPGSSALLQDIMERLALIEADALDRVPALIQLAVERIEHGTEIVLVTTRPLDLSQAEYVERLSGDAARRLAGRGLRRRRRVERAIVPVFSSGLALWNSSTCYRSRRPR